MICSVVGRVVDVVELFVGRRPPFSFLSRRIVNTAPKPTEPTASKKTKTRARTAFPAFDFLRGGAGGG